jgi:sec-independent protein translocase protein TatC
MSTKKQNKSASTPALKSFADHLGELRGRFAWVAIVFIVASALAYNVREQLVSFVLAPIGEQKLVYLTPAGGFAFIFQVTMYAGILATAPIAVYHLYKFVSPALPGHMRRMSIRIVVVSTLLMLLGVGFGYFVAIPAALQFLTAFAGDFVQANLTADSYLSFVVAYVLGLGLLFQLPLLLVFWNWIQPFKPGGLLNTQRFVLVGAFIAAAMITPTPDVLNQCLIAVPIIGIYQLGVVAVYFMNKKRRRMEAKTARIRQAGDEQELLSRNLERPVLEDQFYSPAADVQLATTAHSEPSKASMTVTHTSRPVRSLDGFSRVRRTSVGVPPRQHTLARPEAARPQAVRTQQRPGLQGSQTSIDGFTFV